MGPMTMTMGTNTLAEIIAITEDRRTTDRLPIPLIMEGEEVILEEEAEVMVQVITGPTRMLSLKGTYPMVIW